MDTYHQSLRGYRQANKEGPENTHKTHSAIAGVNSTESTVTDTIIFADLITIARNVAIVC